MLDKYFDMIIVQSDPVFARIEEFFQPQNVLRVPVYHTGFVSSEDGAQPADPAIVPDTVLVSAGDGEHGGAALPRGRRGAQDSRLDVAPADEDRRRPGFAGG